jgi:predicted NBD/HSP70 family sugar kinase
VLEQEEFPTDANARKTISHIIDCARRFIRKNGETIEGVGVSMPGLVDQETGTASFIPHFKWRDLEIAEEIRAAVGLIVMVDNDANAAALAELWFGRPEIREIRDFIMVLIEEGIGTGVVFDGQVHRGKSGAAGEFGHMTIGHDAPVACAAGSRRCWEAFASERAALARYAKLKRGTRGSVQFGQLIELALDGDEDAQFALSETAKYLGVGIANLIQGLSPEAVIVGGPIVRAWSLIANDIRIAVQEHICRGLPPAQIIASTLGAEPTLMGALSLVLMTKFAHVSFS